MMIRVKLPASHNCNPLLMLCCHLLTRQVSLAGIMIFPSICFDRHRERQLECEQRCKFEEASLVHHDGWTSDTKALNGAGAGGGGG